MPFPETKSHLTPSPAATAAGDAALYRSCVVPMVLFLGFNLLLWLLQSGMQWDHPDAPWWQRAPEMLIYPIQTIVCLGYLTAIRRGIRWDATWAGCSWGCLFGVVGIALWLIPYYAGWVPAVGGFEPERIFGDDTAAIATAYAFRFARAVLVVPFVEELFWRGFLMRWCVDRDFPQQVPFGTHSRMAYVVVTLAFMLVHTPADYAGAFLYGSLAYLLTVKTKRLMPIICMHAVANLIMGVCAIVSYLPHLW